MDIAYMVDLPIPSSTDIQRLACESMVNHLLIQAANRQEKVKSFLDWLHIEYAIDKPTQKLANVLELDADGLIAEVKKIRGRRKPLTVAGLKHLRDEHAKAIAPARTQAAEALRLERELGNLVNEAYGLTPDEVALMWKTAPPRMPYPPG